MKWVFLLGLVIFVPLLIGALRVDPQRRLIYAGFALGALPFALMPFHLLAAPVSWATWPGEVKGIEVTLLDGVALAILAVTPRTRIPGPVLAAFGFYLFAVLFSSLMSVQRMAALFYIWQLIRTVLLCVAVARATAVVRNMPIAILAGAGAGLVVASLDAGIDMLHGATQTGGFLGHQNALGLASHFIAYPAIALALAGRRMGLALVIIAAELLAVIAGGSRATVGLFGFGVVVTMLLSCMKQMTGRKTAMAAGLAIALAVSAPVFIWAMNRRSEEARASSDYARGAMIRAARMMIADHPLGVGPNQYVLVANIGGYSARAGVAWDFSNRVAPVHNSYYLAAAQFGLMGLLAFAGMILAAILTGLRAIRRAALGERTEMLIGATAALIVVGVHIAFEWITMTYFIHYFFAMALGTIIGIRATGRAGAPTSAAPPRAPARAAWTDAPPEPA